MESPIWLNNNDAWEGGCVCACVCVFYGACSIRDCGHGDLAGIRELESNLSSTLPHSSHVVSIPSSQSVPLTLTTERDQQANRQPGYGVCHGLMHLGRSRALSKHRKIVLWIACPFPSTSDRRL